MKKTFIIYGGNFQNTGAEAMTYVTVCELRKKYPDCDIYMVSNSDEYNDNLTFNIIGIGHRVENALMKGPTVKFYAAGALKILLQKGNEFKQYRQWRRLIDSCDGFFDISGYAISSQWPDASTEQRLRWVDYLSAKNIPVYFLPQSFGPFDYKNRDEMCGWIKSSMPKAHTIFAREKEGFRLLSELIGNDNLELSSDMVLQTQTVKNDAIFKTAADIEDYALSTEGNVAIIPNLRILEHGNREDILSFYRLVISFLVSKGRTVYLISHSSEDMEVCEMIKREYGTEDRVIVFENEVDCIGFDSLIKNFDFAVASRYHSIVHAYKAGVPCIALGWATKYRELLDSVDQSDFIFDVRNARSEEDVLNVVEHMCNTYQTESETIKRLVGEIQKNNCFDLIDF